MTVAGKVRTCLCCCALFLTPLSTFGVLGCGVGEVSGFADEEVDVDQAENDSDGMRQTLASCPSGGNYAPPPRSFSGGIEGFAGYVGQTQCSGAKPGVVAFRDFVLATYPCTSSGGIVRGCSVGGRSEHKEGRAWDWMVSANNPAGLRLLAWLLAADAQGNPAALARRLGIMYIVFNRRIWRAYRASQGWQPYSGSNPHTDHVHFSFSHAGANKQTSFWGGAGAAPHPGGSYGGGANPLGYLDSVSSSAVARGWACDHDDPKRSIAVHLYVGGPAGSGAPGYALTANATHEDAVTWVCKGGTKHRYSFQLPKDSCGKPVYAYGINIGGGSHTLLTQSGRTVPCNDPRGVLDGITTAGRAWGWACDRDDPNASIAVHLYVGGPAGSGAPGYSVTANIASEAAVMWECAGGKAHRFSITLPGGAANRGKRVYAYGINLAGGKNVPLANSGRVVP